MMAAGGGWFVERKAAEETLLASVGFSSTQAGISPQPFSVPSSEGETHVSVEAELMWVEVETVNEGQRELCTRSRGSSRDSFGSFHVETG